MSTAFDFTPMSRSVGDIIAAWLEEHIIDQEGTINYELLSKEVDKKIAMNESDKKELVEMVQGLTKELHAFYRALACPYYNLTKQDDLNAIEIANNKPHIIAARELLYKHTENIVIL